MKKIMILGAGDYQMPLIKTASLGNRVIVVAPVISEECKKLAYKTFEYDVRDKKAIVDIAIEEGIDGIITDQTDIPVRTVAYVAEKMNLPGIGYEKACLFTDKGKMRTELEKLGIKVLPYKNVDNLDEAKDFFNQLNDSAIIKPVDNQGSRGVFRIDSLEDLEKYFADSIGTSDSNMVVIEKYAKGREFVVEAACVNHKYQELILGDTIYFENESVYSAKQRLFPSEADEKIKQRVSNLNRKIICGFGLKQGISHSEYIMDGDDIYLIETAARGGGVFISSDLIRLSTGLDTNRFLIDLAIDGIKDVPNIKKDICNCGYMAFYLPEGKVVKIEGVDEIEKYGFVYSNLLDKIKIGMKTMPIKDKTSRYSIIVSGKTRKDLMENMNVIKDTLNIEVETKEGIENPIWD